MKSSENIRPADELVTWVDRDNQVLGSVSRRRMRQERLCHRAVYVLVFDHEGRLCVHERTSTKDFRPGWFELSAGGVVAADESYDVAATRELAEELGVIGVPLTSHGIFFDEAPDYQVWGAVYSCVYSGPLTLQPEEVADAWFMELPAISEVMLAKTTETSLKAFRHWQLQN
ncbi:NUDIX hydrolase YfcD [Pokkaliibacter sp. CJK22405]|uniref:NUDIX hydrolase YfcD n=1 Tax=Pokkaliibacter sp. CJK22405 TaxID=3384615 RepID=UPI0039851F2B